MTCTAYSDLAGNCVSGQKTVWVTVDNNPGNMVKLDAGLTAEAFNDIKANITERLGDTASSSTAIFVGGHSAGGYSAIAAMQENGGDYNFKPIGCVAADPWNKTKLPTLKIECQTFAMGFTVETCFVTPVDAGLAAYNITSNQKDRVMMQMINPRDRGNQITHCIFATDGCTACPAHQAGDWTRPVMGKFCILFVDSVVKGKRATKAQYVDATGDNSSLVNVFFGDEVATV